MTHITIVLTQFGMQHRETDMKNQKKMSVIYNNFPLYLKTQNTDFTLV